MDNILRIRNSVRFLIIFPYFPENFRNIFFTGNYILSVLE